MNRIRHIGNLALALMLFLLAACTNDPIVESAGGGILLSISGISTNVRETRTTPDKIYDFSDEEVLAAFIQRFQVKVVRNRNGVTIYDGPFTSEKISAAPGEYTVIVSSGINPVVGTDAPYFEGSATATVPESATEPTPVEVKARVANALISASFGDPDKELSEIGETDIERFNKFYSDYALYVYNGAYNLPITKSQPFRSIYLPAGAPYRLRFWGKLRAENDREVSCDLESESLPASLSPGDHLRVMLTLPDPESDLIVSISKIEVESVVLDETIPLSWLPVSAVAHSHQYDAQGNLVGTNLMFTNSYPGMKWKAVVKNAAGTTVRAVQGTDALFSEYSKAGSWPYLPSGEYTAYYYLIGEDDSENLTSSREFQVSKPKISVSVGGYSSYTKYLQGDIEGANACERLTVYEPSVALSVDESLLRNTHYPYTFTYTYNGETVNVQAGQNSYMVEKVENNAVRANPYVLKADATFDGVSVEAQTGFLITGLPYSFNAASHSEWSDDGKVEWSEDGVQLGGWSAGDQTITTNSSVYIPQGTRFCADYTINIHHSWVGTTFSIQVGGQQILSIEEGPIFIAADVPHTGTTDVVSANGNHSSITCRNSYGADLNWSNIYFLRFKYGQ